MYQRKVDMDMLNAVKIKLADVSSVSPSSEQSFALTKGYRSKRQPTRTLRRLAYPHQPHVDTLYVLPPRRRRPKLVFTGTSIPLHDNCPLWVTHDVIRSVFKSMVKKTVKRCLQYSLHFMCDFKLRFSETHNLTKPKALFNTTVQLCQNKHNTFLNEYIYILVEDCLSFFKISFSFQWTSKNHETELLNQIEQLSFSKCYRE